MATMNLWGMHPTSKKAELYAFAMPQADMSEIESEARLLGWTGLVWGIASSSGPQEEDDTAHYSEPPSGQSAESYAQSTPAVAHTASDSQPTDIRFVSRRTKSRKNEPPARRAALPPQRTRRSRKTP